MDLIITVLWWLFVRKFLICSGDIWPAGCSHFQMVIANLLIIIALFP
jgi:hypothetical protein